MESRPEDRLTEVDTDKKLLATIPPDNGVNLLAALPHEIQLKIFRKLSLADLGEMQKTCTFFNNILQDNKFWKKKQKQQFTPTPIEDENKNQYHAELLYQRAIKQKRADKKQAGMLTLHRFLKTQPHHWKDYYCGLMLFKGLGTKINHHLGFMKLIDALDIEDYRAAIIIGRVIVEAKIGDPELYAQLMPLLGELRLELMHKLILLAYEKKLSPVNMLLGRIYAYGLGVKADFAIAEKYFLEKMSHIANGLNAIACLKFDSMFLQTPSITIERRIELTIEYLSTLEGKFDKSSLQSVIHYWLAYLAAANGDRDTAISLLENFTSELPCAKVSLAHLYMETDPELAIQCFTEAAELEPISAGELFDLQILFTTLNTAIERTRYLTDCTLLELADHVSAYFRNQMDMDEIAGDPYMVWWLQLAAQAGCTQSLEALHSVDAQQYPFVCYALAVIYEFGVLHSTEVEPNHDKSEKYFHLAQNQDLEEYVLTGHGKDFACNEVMDFLQAKMNATIKNSSA